MLAGAEHDEPGLCQRRRGAKQQLATGAEDLEMFYEIGRARVRHRERDVSMAIAAAFL